MTRRFIPAGLALLLLLLSAVTVRAAETFTVDPVHSSVKFKIRHLIAKTSGRFDAFGGAFVIDRNNLTASTVDFTIKVASIDTDNEDRDNHLRSADFFDVEKYPEMTFKSSGIKQTGETTFDVTGVFTMHGVTKTITIPVELLGFAPGMGGGTVAGFEANFRLDRKDYGLVWNKTLDTGGLVLGDEVEVSINIEAGAK